MSHIRLISSNWRHRISTLTSSWNTTCCFISKDTFAHISYIVTVYSLAHIFWHFWDLYCFDMLEFPFNVQLRLSQVHCAQVFPQNTSCKNGRRWHWYCNIHVPILSNHLFFSWQLQYHLILCFVEVPKRSKTHPRFGTPINHINRGKNKVWHVFDILVHLWLAFMWLRKIVFV